MTGYITPITGNTELLRDWLIDHGAKYAKPWGWFFDGDAPSLPIGLTCLPAIHWEQLQSQEAIGDYIGIIGGRPTIKTRCAAIYHTKSQKLCYLFRDADNRVAVWFTSPKEIELNKTYYITGTVKQHQIYRGERQTVLTRCKYELNNI